MYDSGEFFANRIPDRNAVGNAGRATTNDASRRPTRECKRVDRAGVGVGDEIVGDIGVHSNIPVQRINFWHWPARVDRDPEGPRAVAALKPGTAWRIAV